MDDAALADHIRRAIASFRDASPLHSELHTVFNVAGGIALDAFTRWGLSLSDVVPLLAGSSPASSAARVHVDRIASAIGDVDVTSLDDVRSAGGGDALDAYLREFGWRCFDGHELKAASLGEHPDIVVAAVRARRAGLGGTTPNADVGARRERVPEAERDLDELLADLHATYSLNDDNVGITFNWPLGTSAYRGRAAVIDDLGAIDIEPGDVLIARVTHAGHNAVFPIAGAVATQEGGLLAHPAVLARELGISAVVGVRNLMDRVHHGDIVEIDPIAGVVRIIQVHG